MKVRLSNLEEIAKITSFLAFIVVALRLAIACLEGECIAGWAVAYLAWLLIIINKSS